MRRTLAQALSKAPRGQPGLRRGSEPNAPGPGHGGRRLPDPHRFRGLPRARPASATASVLTPTGFDQLEFFLAANPGEPAKPLKQIASGGEISRIMLAIKSALAQSDPRPLLVFDELDTGIGGVTANRVGEALKELAGHHQLIVITHLHQVAAQAAHQHRVVKELDGGRTVTRVIPLSAKERVQELARMMGDESSQATLKHARELLAQD